jgi:hypothetical protein
MPLFVWPNKKFLNQIIFFWAQVNSIITKKFNFLLLFLDYLLLKKFFLKNYKKKKEERKSKL